jgi:hypothetical protein
LSLFSTLIRLIADGLINKTKCKPITKTGEVTRYRGVPTQVLKERTTIENVKMSVWQSIFSSWVQTANIRSED